MHGPKGGEVEGSGDTHSLPGPPAREAFSCSIPVPAKMTRENAGFVKSPRESDVSGLKNKRNGKETKQRWEQGASPRRELGGPPGWGLLVCKAVSLLFALQLRKK